MFTCASHETDIEKLNLFIIIFILVAMFVEKQTTFYPQGCGGRGLRNLSYEATQQVTREM